MTRLNPGAPDVVGPASSGHGAAPGGQGGLGGALWRRTRWPPRRPLGQPAQCGARRLPEQRPGRDAGALPPSGPWTCRAVLGEPWTEPEDRAASPEQAIGPDVLATLTQRTGLSREELLSRLARDLPRATDRYTPGGGVPAKQSRGSTAVVASVMPSPGHGGTDAACRRSLRGSSLLEGCANGRASGCGSRRASRLPDRGGGPAGLTAALYLARFERRFLAIDAGDSRASWILTSHTECME